MVTKKKTIITTAIVGCVWLFLGISCEKVEITRSGEVDDEIEVIDDQSGISFEMENDSLEDEIKNIIFDPQEWEEEGMGVDL